MISEAQLQTGAYIHTGQAMLTTIALGTGEWLPPQSHQGAPFHLLASLTIDDFPPGRLSSSDGFQLSPEPGDEELSGSVWVSSQDPCTRALMGQYRGDLPALSLTDKLPRYYGKSSLS